jgi:hypothetical protein
VSSAAPAAPAEPAATAIRPEAQLPAATAETRGTQEVRPEAAAARAVPPATSDRYQ